MTKSIPVEPRDELEQQHADDHSPESAGLARGLARSAASRSAVGRLPVSHAGRSVAKLTARTAAAQKSAGMARQIRTHVRPRGGAAAAVPKHSASVAASKIKGGARVASRAKVRSSAGNITTKSAGSANRAVKAAPRGRVHVRRITRASDRASTGLDLVEAASSENSGGIISDQKRKGVVGRMKDALRRIPAFMTTLAKNTVLGMAVFSTYEGVVEYDLSSHAEQGINEEAASTDPFAAASMPRHIGAGFLAGSAHAGVNYAMDGIVRLRQLTALGRAQPSLGLVKGTASPFFPYVLHHAISHSVLFGTYEGTKRFMVSSFGGGSLKDDENDVHYGNLLAIGFAGGIAGSAQHLVSNYTEEVCVTSYSKIWEKHLTLVQRCRLMPRLSLPSGRALAFAFLPSSLGFVSFEYGKEIMTGDADTYIDNFIS